MWRFLTLIRCLLLVAIFTQQVSANIEYVDKTCDKYGGRAKFENAATEMLSAIHAVTAALNNPNSGRIRRMLFAALGLETYPNLDPHTPLSQSDLDILSNLKGSYATIASAIKDPTPGQYFYCDDAMVWSTRKPDPNQPNSAAKFDPTARGAKSAFSAGVPVDPTENNGYGGYLYVPDPTANLPYLEIQGVPNPGMQDGYGYCDLGMAAGASKATTGNGFLVFCAAAFQIPPGMVDSAADDQYWTTPLAVGANLQAHRSRLGFTLLHELGHATDVADDQLVDGKKAYYFWGMASLALRNRGALAASNLAWKNCDTLSFLAYAFLMKSTDWSTNVARNPATLPGYVPPGDMMIIDKRRDRGLST